MRVSLKLARIFCTCLSLAISFMSKYPMHASSNSLMTAGKISLVWRMGGLKEVSCLTCAWPLGIEDMFSVRLGGQESEHDDGLEGSLLIKLTPLRLAKHALH